MESKSLSTAEEMLVICKARWKIAMGMLNAAATSREIHMAQERVDEARKKVDRLERLIERARANQLTRPQVRPQHRVKY